MPRMDIFATSSLPASEPSMLRRQKPSTPERQPESDFDSDDYCDFEDDYFSQTYAPLSCLPTPPMSCEVVPSPFTQALERAFDDESDDDSLLGPAIHMCNLIPTSASLLTPSPTLVQDILHRAALPSPVLELTVVILDSLTPRFSPLYRRQLPIPQSSHIDEIRPELVVLSSLLIAKKFLDDNEMTTKRWAGDIGRELWTCQQINAAERVVCENLDWRIMELAGEWLLAEAREDMRRAGVLAKKRRMMRREQEDLELEMKGGFNEESDGNENGSVQFMGQWTPVESPVAKGRVTP